MFAVAGVSGNTGSVVAEALLDAKREVRVVVRSAEKGKPWRERGAEVAVAALEDVPALTEALRGVEGAYLLLPPDLAATDFVAKLRALTDGVARAVEAAKPGHVVFLSSLGAQHADGTGPIRTVSYAEQRLANTGVPCTFLRASYFAENWGGVAAVAKKDGVVPSFFTLDRPVPMIATADIGAIGARALLEGSRGRRVIELTGPVDPTPHDVAAAFAKVLGRDVLAVEAPLDAVVPTFTAFGVSENVASLYKEMYAGIRSGKVAFEGAPSSIVRGTVTLEQVFRKFAG